MEQILNLFFLFPILQLSFHVYQVRQILMMLLSLDIQYFDFLLDYNLVYEYVLKQHSQILFLSTSLKIKDYIHYFQLHRHLMFHELLIYSIYFYLLIQHFLFRSFYNKNHQIHTHKYLHLHIQFFLFLMWIFLHFHSNKTYYNTNFLYMGHDFLVI